MLPNLFVKVGNYINKHENSKVAIFSEEKIKYKGKMYSNQSFLLTSNKIQHVNFISKSKWQVEVKKMKIMNACNWALTQYSKGISYYKYNIVRQYINKAKLKYIFTTKKNIMSDLSNNDFKIVINGSDYWLLKRK